MTGRALRPGTQSARLLDWLRANPGSSSLEITYALALVNVTGRISDCRAAGFVIECHEDKTGVARYWVREARPVVVTKGEQTVMALLGDERTWMYRPPEPVIAREDWDQAIDTSGMRRVGSSE